MREEFDLYSCFGTCEIPIISMAFAVGYRDGCSAVTAGVSMHWGACLKYSFSFKLQCSFLLRLDSSR